MTRFLFTTILCGAFSALAASEGEGNPSKVAMMLDVSGSMGGNRAVWMKEAAKLFVTTIPPNFEVVIVDFNHSARSACFKLRTSAERQAAARHIDNLRIEGGTNYNAALDAAKLPPGAPALFLSDGENNDGAEPVLTFLKAHRPGPLFTVGIEAPPAADKVLSEMAALTSGSHVKVDDSESVVKAFLNIAKQLGNYRTYSPKEEKVICKHVVGQVVAFGFDSVPSLMSNPPLSKTIHRHHAALPGEKVNLAAVELGVPTSVTISATQKQTPQGRLAAILRQDLLRAKMDLDAPSGKAAMGGELKASTKFYDLTGKPIDPRKRPDLSSVFQLLDESGKILAKVIARSSPTEAALEATIPLPKNAGPVTVKNLTVDSSQGPGFEAEQSRTILLQKPVALSVQPQQIKLAVPKGRFNTKLTVKIQHGTPLAATFSAQIDTAVKDIRLLQAKSEGENLEMELEANRAGIVRGFFVIQGAAAVPIETMRVPFEVTVKETALGIALPESRTLRFGPILANGGSKQIGTLEIPSLDKDMVHYSVDIEDLSDGTTVIPFNTDQSKITPTKDKPGRLVLTAEIGNVATGDYSASIIVRPLESGANKEWRTKVLVTVTEPLSVRPVDFGTIEVGKVIQRSLNFANTSEPLPNIQIVKAVIEAKGGDIIATLPDKIAMGARQDKEVPIKLTVSPLVESRGLHKGTLVIRRNGKQELVVPIQVTVVDLGKGPCGLLAAPAVIQIRCKAGEVQQFDVRTKFVVTSGTAVEELAAEAATFKDATGKSINLDVAFKWQPGAKLTRATPVTMQGFLIAPDRRGIYTSTLTIRSKDSGTIIIPLTLEVQ